MSELLAVYIPYAIGAFSFLWLLSKIVEYRTFKSSLDGIPTIGHSGVLTSYLSAFKTIKHSREIIQEGYEKFNGSMFKIPMLGHWLVVVSGPTLIDEVRKAPDDHISFLESTRDTLQVEYTLGKSVHFDPYHIDVIRTSLTRNIAAQFADVRDEAVAAFNAEIPVTEDWVKVPVMKTILNIVCRTSNRVFVGLPLCRNPDYMNLNIQFTINVVLTAKFINLWPNFMKPIVGKALSPIERGTKRAMKYLRPIIEERFAKIQEYGRDYPDKPNDLLSWLIDDATTSERRTPRDLTTRILAVNFAAIHTTSMTFTNALYYLAGHPEYVKDLREEVESMIEEYGWTKVAMGQSRKLDSFMKESQRLQGIGAVVMDRKVMRDFTFSDGTTIPAGAKIAVASDAIHHDESIYQNANEFRAFRFAEMREAEGESFKHQMVTPDIDYITFGIGRHACPGRFFAVNEIKALIAHILLTYDVKLEEEGRLPPQEWFGTSSSPDRSAAVMFRKRRA